MKTILLFVFLLIIGWESLNAQNLVPNPGFETITSCPTGNSQIALAVPWNRPAGSITTPDLCHTCFTGSGTACNNVDVPSNFGGATNPPHTGDSYAGILTSYGGCSTCREYIQVQLTAPLVAGQTYDAGFWALLSDFSRRETNRLDMYISNTPPSQPSNGQITGVTPQITSGVVSDANNWTLISGTYTASGGEQYITIGNFYNNANTTVNFTGATGGSCALVTNGVIYFIDDVFVEIPVVLNIDDLDFQLEKGLNESAVLDWALSNQEDYQFVSVQRSADGVQFSNVKDRLEVYATQWVDDRPLWGDNYYRLRLLHNDGSIHYSDVKTLNFQSNSELAFHIYPNPFSNYINVEFLENELQNQELTINLVDMLGRRIYQQTVQVSGDSQLIQVMPREDLPNGTYILQIATDGFTTERKLVKR